MIIDGTDLILGRLATFAAKKVLEGEIVDIVNCENVIISGRKNSIIEDYKRIVKMGDPYKGPFFPKMPDRIVRRTIRGMLPIRKARGREAFKRIMCHIGVPDKFKGKKLESVKEAEIGRLKSIKLINLKRLSEGIGKVKGA